MKFYYLISSLALLRFGEKAVLNVKAFMECCKNELAPEQYGQLDAIGLLPPECDNFSSQNALGKFYQWECALRNELIKRRGGQKASEKYERSNVDFFSEIAPGVQEAYNSDPLQKERTIDLLRWKFLDSLEAGCDFDFDFLCVYKLKLLILEKYIPRDTAAGRQNLERLRVSLCENDSVKN